MLRLLKRAVKLCKTELFPTKLLCSAVTDFKTYFRLNINNMCSKWSSKNPFSPS